MLFAIGLVAGLLIAGLNQKTVTVNVESNVSLDQFDDDDTDAMDDDDDGYDKRYRESLN